MDRRKRFIFKLKKESFLKLSYFFKKIRDKKIDMTTFLNESIRKKQVKFFQQMEQATAQFHGDGNQNATVVTFQRIGDI